MFVFDFWFYIKSQDLLMLYFITACDEWWCIVMRLLNFDGDRSMNFIVPLVSFPPLLKMNEPRYQRKAN